MLTIRQSQMRVMHQQLRHRLAERITEHLRKRFRSESWLPDRPALLAIARATLSLGERYGMKGEDDLVRLSEYVLLFGPALDQRQDAPWIGDSLRADSEPHEKLDLMDRHYTFSRR